MLLPIILIDECVEDPGTVGVIEDHTITALRDIGGRKWERLDGETLSSFKDRISKDLNVRGSKGHLPAAILEPVR